MDGAASAGFKRDRPEDEANGQTNGDAKRFKGNVDLGAGSNHCAARLIINKADSGGLIGKGGSSISAIRTNAGCNVKVGAKSAAGATVNRLVTVDGTIASVTEGIVGIAKRIAEVHEGPSQGPSDKNGPSGPYSCYILVASAGMGSIIGKGGSRINELRAQSGTVVKISGDCLGTSDEKTVGIGGDEEGLRTAVFKVLTFISGDSQKTTPRVPYEPGVTEKGAYPGAAPGGYGQYNRGPPSQPPAYGAPASRGYGAPQGGYGAPPSSYGQPPASRPAYGGPPPAAAPYNAPPASTPYNPYAAGSGPPARSPSRAQPPPYAPPPTQPAYGGPPARGAGQWGAPPARPPQQNRSYGAPPAHLQPTIQEGTAAIDAVIQQNQQSLSAAYGSLSLSATLPSSVCGAIIGKGGMHINRIRQESGATVRIGEAVEGRREVTVTGTGRACQHALQLVRQRVEQQ